MCYGIFHRISNKYAIRYFIDCVIEYPIEHQLNVLYDIP